jgi:hypothetical protein
LSEPIRDQLISVLGSLRKARASPVPGRDFAVVMVQTPEKPSAISILSTYSSK